MAFDSLADPLSEILSSTNARSLVTGGFTAGGRWALRFPVPNKIKFFAVTKGVCWVTIDGETPAQFSIGDVGLLTAPRAFTLASDLDVEPVDAMPLFSGSGRATTQIGGGQDFAYLGGHVLLDHSSGSFLADVLPPWMHINAASPQAAAFRSLLDQLVTEREANLPGARLVSMQLSQLLFIQILRAQIQASANGKPAGWLAALADRRLAPALRLLHAAPARAWSLNELAVACAMSRSSFALHFKAVVGVSPLAYLTRWRMHLAERALREPGATVAKVAEAAGYASESAFSNAFKRVLGMSPKASRETRTAA